MCCIMLPPVRKAFYPARPPLPLLHLDTRWRFRDMYIFRDRVARYSELELLVHINPQAIAQDVNLFDHGRARQTEIIKTEVLKQALDKYNFDLVFGGARRNEEKSRANERIFSIRGQNHRLAPKTNAARSGVCMRAQQAFGNQRHQREQTCHQRATDF